MSCSPTSRDRPTRTAASERSEASHAPAFAPKALRRGLAVALAEAETEGAGEAARERACKGVRGAKPLGVIMKGLRRLAGAVLFWLGRLAQRAARLTDYLAIGTRQLSDM